MPRKNARYGLFALLIALPAALFAQANDVAPPVAAAIAAPPSESVPSAPKAAEAAAPEEKYKPVRVKIASLFFTQDEINALHIAMATYIKRNAHGANSAYDEEDFLNQLTGSKNPQQRRFYTYPQFFLESLVYHSPGDWLVWVNGRKLTSTAMGGGEISVIRIDADKVTFEWHPAEMEKATAVWNQAPNDEVVLDPLRNTVTFSLKPNQTFSAFVMRALEGKVLPVTVDTNMADAQAPQGAIPANPSDALSASDAIKDEDRRGLHGLIGAYKRLDQETKP